MSTATGWPFLIARGRHHGYRVLAAPPFLVRNREEGFLEDVVGPAPDAVATRLVTDPSGRRLCLVWGDHRVRGAEVGEPGDPVDEHSRPLRLLYGFVCQDAVVSEPSPVDLDRSLATTLATYRRFLRGEAEFDVEESAPFPVTARAVPRPEPVTREPGARRPSALLTGAALAAALVVLAVVWWFAARPEPSPREPLVTLGTTVNGTIDAAGQENRYLVDTGSATRIAIVDARPGGLDVALSDADTGDRLAPGPDGTWTVEANTRYRLTVTSVAGRYAFRLDDRATTRKPGDGSDPPR